MEINYISVNKDNKYYTLNISFNDIGESVAKLDTGATSTCLSLSSLYPSCNINSLWSRIVLKAKSYGVFERPFFGIGDCKGILVSCSNVILGEELIIPNFYFDLLKMDRATLLLGVDLIDQFRMFKNPHTNIVLDSFDHSSYCNLYYGRKALPFEEVISLL